MNKEEFDILVNEILEIPKTEEIYTASSMCAINIDELRKVIDAFNKIPNYNELIKDNNKKAKQISQLTNNWNELEEWSGKEIERLRKKYDYALKLLSDFNMPCDFAGFMDEYPDYCEKYCTSTDESYKMCWNKYIECQLEKNK